MGGTVCLDVHGHIAVVNDRGIVFSGEAFRFKADIRVGMGACIAAQTANGVTTVFALDSHISGAVGDGVHHFQTATNAAQTHRLVAGGFHGAGCCAVVDAAAKAAADYQTAALGNVCLNDLIGKVVVTDDDHGSPLHHAVGDRVVVTAHNTADTVIAGNGGIALQCDVIHRTHVVAHNAANGHGSAFRYCDRGIFQSQVFHLTAAHAEQTGTAVIGIRSIAQVGNSVAVSVKGAEEQGGVCLHVVHIADGSPLDTGQVQITGQFEANTGVAALRAIVDIGSKGQQGIHAVDLVGVFLRAGTAVIVGGNSSGADGRSSRRTCGSAACGTLGGRTCTA